MFTQTQYKKGLVHVPKYFMFHKHKILKINNYIHIVHNYLIKNE